MNTDLMFSSDAQDWRTPPEILELVRKVGLIALDPATDESNPTSAKSIFTSEYNGLKVDWRAWLVNGGLAYCNPPYGRELADWATKFSAEGMRGTELITLTPSRTDTQWFRKMTTSDAKCFWRGRIKFFSLNPLTGQWERGAWDKKKQKWNPDQPAAFPSLFCYWGPRSDRFHEVFGPYGWCP